MEKNLLILFLAFIGLPAASVAEEIYLKQSQYRDAQNPTAVISATQPSLVVAMPQGNADDFQLQGTTASLGLSEKLTFNTTLGAQSPEAVEPSAGPQPKIVMGLNYSF